MTAGHHRTGDSCGQHDAPKHFTLGLSDNGQWTVHQFTNEDAAEDRETICGWGSPVLLIDVPRYAMPTITDRTVVCAHCFTPGAVDVVIGWLS